MKAIILVGGFGTRLATVVPDQPKPMAPIQGKPFLAYLVEYLKSQGFTSVTFSVHHMQEKIRDYFHSNDAGIEIDYVYESSPLGTGGAIQYALRQKKFDVPVFILNGDTFVQMDYRNMYAQHCHSHAELTMALAEVDDVARYGQVVVSDGIVKSFCEKGKTGSGAINAGVYLLNPDVLTRYHLPEQFSLEKDFLLPHVNDLNIHAFTTNNYFIDIGVPDDYERANVELPELMTALVLPKISVIMPVFNREDTIEKAILSVINQRYPNTEFIILDAGSRDKTTDIIKQYEGHIAYWHSKPDRGAGDVTNYGLSIATGDLIVLLMADDWFEPDTFKKVGKALADNPAADMITCGGKIVTNHGETLFSYTKPSELRLTLFNMMFSATPTICSRFIRKTLFERIGVFDALDDHGQQILSNDREFLMRAALFGAKNKTLDHVGHVYLAHQESYSFSNNRKVVLRHCHEHMQHAENYLKRDNLTFLQRLALLYWYGDQSARLFMFNLLASDWHNALQTVLAGIRKYPFIWPFTFVTTAFGIVGKKILRLAR